MPGNDVNRVLQNLAKKHGVDLNDVGPKTKAMLRELAEGHLEASRLSGLLQTPTTDTMRWPEEAASKH